MQVFLRDLNSHMVNAWNKYFKDEPDVHVSYGDIFAPGPHMVAEAIVSPANSFGFMDGGIDYVYSMELGWEMSEFLRKMIDVKHSGELLVGQAEVVDIHMKNPKAKFRYLISAPTMRTPCNVARTANAYLAFRATLQKAEEYGINSVLCPGLGTMVGEMPFGVCALQMYEAWKTRGGNHKKYSVLAAAHMRNHMLMTPAAYDAALQAGQ